MNPDPSESLLRHGPFVLYWHTRVFASMAFQMVGVAVGWQIYELTGSAFDLGLVGLVQFLPALFLILIAGQLADRYNRRMILQLCQAVEGLAAAALALGSLSGWIGKEYILLALAFLGGARSFEATTSQTLLPAIVPVSLFPRAVASSASTTQFATIAGPSLGGLLYGLGGAPFVYGLSACLFACAVVLLAFIRVPQLPSSRPPLTPEVFFAGIAFIRRNKIVLGVMLLDLFAVLLGGAIALMPIFAKDVFHAGPVALGLLRAAPAVGGILMMIALTQWTFRRHLGRIMFATVACYGVATIVFALSSSLPLSLAALVALGASDAISVVIRMTLVQIETPDEMRGRVSAVNSLFVSMSNQIGDFRAGLVAAWIGAIPAVLVGGIGTLLVVFAATRLFPQLYDVESFVSNDKESSAAAGAQSP